MSIKDFLAFALVILLAVAIFAPSASDSPVAATVYPATSSYMAAETGVLEDENGTPHVSSTGNTLNSDMKVLVQVGMLAAIGLFARSVVRRWQYR